MLSQSLIYFSILFLLIVLWLLRNRIRYWSALLMERGWKSTVHYDRCLRVFNKLYADVNAYRLSLDERDQKNLTNDKRYVYGEVTFYNFLRLLEVAELKTGDVFYDLGSGAGKAVFIAGLVFDLKKAVGIEQLDSLYQLSVTLREKLETIPEREALLPQSSFHIDFIQGDFLTVDFSDADVIFINATCFTGEMWDKITEKFLQLKKGARIIVNSQSLNVGGFERKYGNMHLMSWGMCYVSIYERV